MKFLIIFAVLLHNVVADARPRHHPKRRSVQLQQRTVRREARRDQEDTIHVSEKNKKTSKVISATSKIRLGQSIAFIVQFYFCFF